MSLRKHGTGQILPTEKGEIEDGVEWTPEDSAELAEENKDEESK